MAGKAENLTRRTLDALNQRAKDNPDFSAYLADGGQPGLAVVVRRGRVRYVFNYRPPQGGARRRFQIDSYEAITLRKAREIAQSLRGKVAAGVDPQDERAELERQALTLGEAIEGYLEDFRERAETGARRGKRSGYASARRRLERHVVPRLGKARVREIGSDQIQRLHRSMKNTPVEANRTLTALSAVFGWADRSELIPAGLNPTRYVQPYRETGRRRALTDEELGRLGHALHEAQEERSLHPSAILAIRLLALTGFRRAEVLGHTMKNRRGNREGLRWGDVDLNRGLVQLHDTKTGVQTRVLGNVVVNLLRDAKPKKARDTDCVCPGTIPGQPFYGIDKPRKALWKAADLEGLKGVDLHSLRHSFASMGAHVEQGRYVGMVSALLGHGHQSRAVTERYITSNPEALRPAADAIAGELARLLEMSELNELSETPDLRSRAVG